MGGPTHPRQLALQTGSTESGSLRAVRGAVEQATVPVPVPLGSSELASSDVGLIGVLAAVLADEVACRLVLQLERTPPEPEPLQPAAAGAWLTVDEVSRMVRLSHRTVYRALRSGALAGEKVGALWRIRPAAVESWATQAGPASSPESGPAVVAGTGVAGGDGRRRHGGSVRPTSYRARSARGPPDCGVRETAMRARVARPSRRTGAVIGPIRGRCRGGAAAGVG
jgi:excisionase family DNA binding protein